MGMKSKKHPKIDGEELLKDLKKSEMKNWTHVVKGRKPGMK
jgi:hypothetical protein